MSTGPERPTFFEGQILAAADLGMSVDVARAAQARHARYLHTSGIATGLALRSDKRSTVDGKEYVTVTLTKGVAFDSTGREIVVPDDEPISEAVFDSRGLTAGQPADALYPIFLMGRDESAPLPPVAGGACASGGETRKVEGHEIKFEAPRNPSDLNAEAGPDSIASGPGNGAPGVLLGFVQWDDTLQKFTAVKFDARGARRQFAGVRADEVRARGESLTLRTGRDPLSPASAGVVIDETDGGELRFGPANPDGEINWVFKVTSKGDVSVKGKIVGTPGNVQVQSGIATDGLTLPLPPGITQELVDSGKVALHIHLSPRLPVPAVPAVAELVMPLECRLEEGTRRVLCRNRKFTVAGSVVADEIAICDYLIIASAPPPAENAGGTP